MLDFVQLISSLSSDRACVRSRFSQSKANKPSIALELTQEEIELEQSLDHDIEIEERDSIFER